MDTTNLADRLEKFPQLKNRIEEMLKIAENSDGGIELADAAEEMIIMTGRQLNHDTLQAWAQTQSGIKSEQFEQKHKGAQKDEKKTPVAQHVRKH